MSPVSPVFNITKTVSLLLLIHHMQSLLLGELLLGMHVELLGAELITVPFQVCSITEKNTLNHSNLEVFYQRAKLTTAIYKLYLRYLRSYNKSL